MADRSALEAATVEAAIDNRILAEVGLAVGVRASLGHGHMRVPGDPNLFVVKGRGYRMDVLSRMHPEDMVVCDLEDHWVDGPPYSLQCSEVKIHSCLDKNRPDVVSVVHVPPDDVVLMRVLQNGLTPMAQEGARLVINPLPVYPHTKILTSEEEGQEVARLLGYGEAYLLLGHKAVTASPVGGEDAVLAMGHLEHQTRLNSLPMCAAAPIIRPSRCPWPRRSPWLGPRRSPTSEPAWRPCRAAGPTAASGPISGRSSRRTCSL